MKIERMINRLQFQASFFFRNLFYARKLRRICATEFKGYSVTALSKMKFQKMARAYSLINGSEFLGGLVGLSCFINSSKLIFLVLDNSNEIIGIQLFYFNKRDCIENTVHEAFIGVSEKCRNLGIATFLRENAIGHFKSSHLHGISTRISKYNVASLKSAERMGFKVVEEYFDPSLKEERYYMICEFHELGLIREYAAK